MEGHTLVIMYRWTEKQAFNHALCVLSGNLTGQEVGAHECVLFCAGVNVHVLVQSSLIICKP